MSDDPQMDTIPWYKSPQQISHVTAAVSALIALSPKVAALLGNPAPEAVSMAVGGLFGFIAFLAPTVGAIFRAKSKVQPLVLTQKKADAANVPSTPPATTASK
jgi:hypothetical protein